MNVKACLDNIIADELPPREGNALLERLVKSCPDGLIMEFGVATGASFRLITDYTDRDCYGFDSFKGLPEDAPGWHAGTFACDVPTFHQPNAHIVEGLIQHTLPAFLMLHQESAAFVHIDTDIYSSCKYILETLYSLDRLVPETIILFDEMFNCENNSYVDWAENEYKAFVEFGETTGMQIEFLGRREANSYAFKII